MKLFGQILVIFLTTIFASFSFAYNTLYTTYTGAPVACDNSEPIQYWLDPGELGLLTNEQLHTLLQEAMQVWENVETANPPRFEFAGYLPEDVNGTNYEDYVQLTKCYTNDLDSCPTQYQKEFKTIIIFDADNEILENELCRITSCTAKAGPGTLERDDNYRVSRILQGQAVFGNSYSNQPNSLTALFIHELGHLLGLGHTSLNQVLFTTNLEMNINNAIFYPTMQISTDYNNVSSHSYTGTTLSFDDMNSLSVIYPSDDFETTTASITGLILKSDNSTMSRVNVVARNIDDPLCMAYSTITDRYCPHPGALAQHCNAGAETGEFILEGLPPGTYTLEVEEISQDQNVNDLQVDLAGDAEFWNEGDVANEDPYLRTEITVAAGEVIENVNIILNGNTSEDRERYIPLNQFTIPEETSCVDSTIDYAELIGYDGGTTESSTPTSGGCSLIVPKN